jgi:hypothetical protein
MSETKKPLFVLGSAIPDFWWTVRIPSPSDNDYTVAELDVLFAPVGQDKLDRIRGIGLRDDETPPTDAQICQRVVRGWRGLKNEQGEDVPFAPEALEQLLRAPMVRSAIVATYLAAMSGTAARKNA